MFGFVLSRFVNGNINAAERNKTFSGMETFNITDLACNQSCGGVADPGNGNKVRTQLVHQFLYPSVVFVDPFLNMLHVFYSVKKFESIAIVGDTDRMLCGFDNIGCRTFTASVQQRINLGNMSFCKLLRSTVFLEYSNGRAAVNVAEKRFQFGKNDLNKVVYSNFRFP